MHIHAFGIDTASRAGLPSHATRPSLEDRVCADTSDTALTDGEWTAHLSRFGLLSADVPSSIVTPLSGGVSAQVVRVGDLVCKRPYTRLQVETDWHADTGRVVAEARALDQFGSPSDSPAPRLVHFDPQSRILVQRFVDGRSWKTALLAGEVDLRVAGELGRLLTGIHAADPAPFADGAQRLDQLRLTPYFRFAARTAPEFAGALHQAVALLSEPGQTVVHGDFSPKNILVAREVAAGIDQRPRVTIIDWEVVHVGRPEFDLAFLVSHLRAKSAHRPQDAAHYAAAERAFLEQYRAPFDEAVFSHMLACLLIARVYGRSPLTYLSPESRQSLIETARDLLQPISTSEDLNS